MEMEIRTVKPKVKPGLAHRNNFRNKDKPLFVTEHLLRVTVLVKAELAGQIDDPLKLMYLR